MGPSVSLEGPARASLSNTFSTDWARGTLETPCEHIAGCPAGPLELLPPSLCASTQRCPIRHRIVSALRAQPGCQDAGCRATPGPQRPGPRANGEARPALAPDPPWGPGREGVSLEGWDHSGLSRSHSVPVSAEQLVWTQLSGRRQSSDEAVPDLPATSSPLTAARLAVSALFGPFPRDQRRSSPQDSNSLAFGKCIFSSKMALNFLYSIISPLLVFSVLLSELGNGERDPVCVMLRGRRRLKA